MFLVLINMEMFDFRLCKIFYLLFALIFNKCVIFWLEALTVQVSWLISQLNIDTLKTLSLLLSSSSLETPFSLLKPLLLLLFSFHSLPPPHLPSSDSLPFPLDSTLLSMKLPTLHLPFLSLSLSLSHSFTSSKSLLLLLFSFHSLPPPHLPSSDSLPFPLVSTLISMKLPTLHLPFLSLSLSLSHSFTSSKFHYTTQHAYLYL